jgi:hypothetical protein
MATPSEPSEASPTTSMSGWWSKNMRTHPDDRMVVDDEHADLGSIGHFGSWGGGVGHRLEGSLGVASSLAKEHPPGSHRRARHGGRDDGGDAGRSGGTSCG